MQSAFKLILDKYKSIVRQLGRANDNAQLIAHVRYKLCKLVQLHNTSFCWNLAVRTQLFAFVLRIVFIKYYNCRWKMARYPVDFANKQTKKLYAQNWVMTGRVRECQMEKTQSVFFYVRDFFKGKVRQQQKKCGRMKHQFAINWICWATYCSCCCWCFFNKCRDAKSMKWPWQIIEINRISTNKIIEMCVSSVALEGNYWWNIIDWWISMKTTWHVLISTLIVHFNRFHCICSQLTWHRDMPVRLPMNEQSK